MQLITAVAPDQSGRKSNPGHKSDSQTVSAPLMGYSCSPFALQCQYPPIFHRLSHESLKSQSNKKNLRLLCSRKWSISIAVR